MHRIIQYAGLWINALLKELVNLVDEHEKLEGNSIFIAEYVCE